MSRAEPTPRSSKTCSFCDLAELSRTFIQALLPIRIATLPSWGPTGAISRTSRTRLTAPTVSTAPRLVVDT